MVVHLGHTQCISGSCENGVGTYQFADGSIYQGAFKQGLPDGEGVWEYPKGGKVKGLFKKGLPVDENAFAKAIKPTDLTIKNGLISFHELFFGLPDAPQRTRKHIPTPLRKSSCKRLNMFLRWMVRKGNVDFGIWSQIKPSQLLMPLDVHVERMAHQLGLLQRKQRDWKAVEELTNNLRKIDPVDPVRFDFALFGLGLEGF